MDARVAIKQIRELLDDIQEDAPGAAAELREVINRAEAEIAGQSGEEGKRVYEESEGEEEKPKDFKSAREAASKDKKLFNRDDEESDGGEEN